MSENEIEFHTRNNILPQTKTDYSKAYRFVILGGNRPGSIKQEFFILNNLTVLIKRPVNTI